MSFIYTTEVKVVSVPLEQVFKKYYNPQRFLDYCKECPSYGRVWSCPPGVPDTVRYLSGYDTIRLIAVKVIYDSQTVKLSKTLPAEEINLLMDLSYGKVKEAMRETILSVRNLIEHSIAVAAGECKICNHCARVENKPCRFPDRSLYSFSALGFDLSKISTEILNIPILWESKGLPEYIVALAALVTK